MNLIQQNIQKLRDDLHRHNHNYYVLDKPVISDFEFDSKLKELKILEDKFPQFNDENMNQQHRFITLIDVLYEKKIPLITSSFSNFKNMGSSRKLVLPFKRTISRLFELTSSNFY